MRINYDSNNSGGSWWLEDKDWKALEEAGWCVSWGGYTHRFGSYEEAVAAGDKGRYLAALASRAWKDFESVEDAEREFEKITGQSAYEEGCECCGPPHNFYNASSLQEDTNGL